MKCEGNMCEMSHVVHYLWMKTTWKSGFLITLECERKIKLGVSL